MTGLINRETKCRSCDAPILFIKTKNGKTMPVNAEPVWIRKDAAGKTYIKSDGSFITGEIVGDAYDDPENKPVEAYVSHFATCPQAENFRKRGKKP